MKQTDDYDITPDKSLVKKLGMVGYRTSQALAELVDNSIDARIPDKCQNITVHLDFKGICIVVEDDGTGMDGRDLADAMTIARGVRDDSGKRLGRFGMGMKSACSALGRRFEITTSTGDGTEYHTKYDEGEWLGDENQGWENLKITKTVHADGRGDGGRSDGGWHGTRIVISNLSVPLYPNQVPNLKKNFGIRYSPYLDAGQIALRINTVQCRPAEPDIEPGSTVPLQVPLDFGREITGHLALLKRRSIRGSYGIHLFWNGRLIKAFAKIGFRAHPENAKIIGSINLDHVPVNYTKSGFLEESAEYAEVVRKLASSDPMKTMRRRSAAVADAGTPSVKSIFDHVVSGADDGYKMGVRASAESSMRSIASTKRFVVGCGDLKKIDVRIENGDPDAPLYVADVSDATGDGGTTRVSINAGSDAFRFAKNPLFVIGMIASESKLLAAHPEMAGPLCERNGEMSVLMSRWRQNAGGLAPTSHRGEAWRQGYSFAESAGHVLSPELVEAHDMLVDRYEFRFQFTALSTLSSYMHDVGGKLVYTIHTTPAHGEDVVELLANSMGDEFAVVSMPSAVTTEEMLKLPRVRRVLAIREYAQITGSTIAAPAKAFVDLMTESSAYGIGIVDVTGQRRILESMLRLGAARLEDVQRYARIGKREGQLDELLRMAAPEA